MKKGKQQLNTRFMNEIMDLAKDVCLFGHYFSAWPVSYHFSFIHPFTGDFPLPKITEQNIQIFIFIYFFRIIKIIRNRILFLFHRSFLWTIKLNRNQFVG